MSDKESPGASHFDGTNGHDISDHEQNVNEKDIHEHSGDEKNGYDGADVPRRMSLAEATARRQSVALNIVENPLKVSFAVPSPAPVPSVGSKCEADKPPFCSASPVMRTSPRHVLMLSRMECPSMPRCSVVPRLLHVIRIDSRWLRSSRNQSAPPSSTRGTTSGTAPSCSGTRSRCVRLERPRKDGTRLDPRVRTCPSRETSVFRMPKATAHHWTNGSLESSMQSFS